MQSQVPTTAHAAGPSSGNAKRSIKTSGALVRVWIPEHLGGAFLTVKYQPGSHASALRDAVFERLKSKRLPPVSPGPSAQQYTLAQRLRYERGEEQLRLLDASEFVVDTASETIARSLYLVRTADIPVSCDSKLPVPGSLILARSFAPTLPTP